MAGAPRLARISATFTAAVLALAAHRSPTRLAKTAALPNAMASSVRPAAGAVLRKQSPQQLAESKAAYAALRESIVSQVTRHNWYVLAVFGILALSCDKLISLSQAAWPCLFSLLFPLLWIQNPRRPLSRKEYYSLPHSRSLDGKHRCIRCGQKAVNRDNPNPTVALTSCANCELRLFKGE